MFWGLKDHFIITEHDLKHDSEYIQVSFLSFSFCRHIHTKSKFSHWLRQIQFVIFIAPLVGMEITYNNVH